MLRRRRGKSLVSMFWVLKKKKKDILQKGLRETAGTHGFCISVNPEGVLLAPGAEPGAGAGNKRETKKK